MIAQSPDTAEFDEMPRRAIDTGFVDVVLPPDEIAQALCESARGLDRRGGEAALEEDGETEGGEDPEAAREQDEEREDPHGLDEGNRSGPLARILATLRQRASVDFRQYKEGTLQRRIDRRVHLHRLESWDRYAELVRERPEELEALAGDLLINVTSFFRDEDYWQTLSEVAIKPLVHDHVGDEPLRVWVAGCASGEEAYSAAIALLEAAGEAGASFGINIFATDISDQALTRARHGVYPAAAIQHLSRERRERWFVTEDDTVRVKEELRETTVFAPQDLTQDPPFSRVDLLICRNVLIYLQPELQRRLIRLFHFALREGGFLFLGSAEGVADAEDLFSTVDKSARIFRRVGPTRHDIVDFPVMRGHHAPAQRKHEPPAIPSGETRRRRSVTDTALKALLDRHAPPAVLVDRALNIVYYQGTTDRFLKRQSGEPTNNLLALARDGLASHLRRVVEAAKASGEVETVRFHAPVGDALVPLQLEAAPVHGEPDSGVLVSFIEDGPAGERRPGEDAPLESSREEELEAEVSLLRKEIGEMTRAESRAEQEFKAYNEELTSMNEELRASNEELQTSKEELQSLNEELGTVNSQLRSKVSELNDRTADLHNLLASTDVASLFLDENLAVRWYSPRVEELFHVRQADTGRPVSHLVRHFHDEALEEECRRVLRTLAPAEANVELPDERTFTRRITPYRSADDRIAGVVVNFSDVSEIQNARLFAERIVETVPTPFLVLDTRLRVKMANPAFYETFHVAREETEGHKIYDLGNRQWDIPELRRLLDDILPDNEVFIGYEVTHEFEQIGRKTMLLNGRRLDHVQLILLGIDDITDRKDWEAHQTRLTGELAHRVKNALNVVQGLASQTLRGSHSLDEFKSAFTGRLGAYSRSHSQLLKRDWRPGELRDIVQAVVESHAIDPERVSVDGPSLEVSPKQALTLGLVLHELETNATKYGALSNDDGRVEIRWSLDGDRTLRLRWRERDGPTVTPPDREGFGTSLIRQLVEYDLRGGADFSFPAEGLICEITFQANSGEADVPDAQP